MPKGTPITEDSYNVIKYLQNQSKNNKEIASVMGLSECSVSRIAETVNFADYTEKKGMRLQKKNKQMRANKKQTQVEMADLIPAEQPESTHESLNRDMLKAILQSMQVLAANQSIIASKLDALIQKWE